MSDYMILMRENDRAWANLPPEEQQRLLQLYYDWVGNLRETGVFKDGNPAQQRQRPPPTYCGWSDRGRPVHGDEGDPHRLLRGGSGRYGCRRRDREGLPRPDPR